MNFASKLEGRGAQKIIKSVELSANLVLFCYVGHLANKKPYDRFFSELGPQLGTKNPPKSLPKTIKNQSKITYKI